MFVVPDVHDRYADGWSGRVYLLPTGPKSLCFPLRRTLTDFNRVLIYCQMSGKNGKRWVTAWPTADIICSVIGWFPSNFSSLSTRWVHWDPHSVFLLLILLESALHVPGVASCCILWVGLIRETAKHVLARDTVMGLSPHDHLNPFLSELHSLRLLSSVLACVYLPFAPLLAS